MLLHELAPTHCVDGWLASRKWDGWRVVWDGSQIYTRFGRILTAPEWFVASLPVATLDGELCHESDRVGAVVSAIQRNDWSELCFRAFDAPLHFGAFRQRAEYVQQMCEDTSATWIEQVTIDDYSAARQFARDITAAGGEGAVFRDPLGLYKAGSRSHQVLKFKPPRRLTPPLKCGDAANIH